MTTTTDNLKTLILERIRAAFVIDIGELRNSLPHALQGTQFDAAVLALADARKIVLSQDCLPEAFSPDQLRNYIRCGCELYTVAIIAR